MYDPLVSLSFRFRTPIWGRNGEIQALSDLEDARRAATAVAGIRCMANTDNKRPSHNIVEQLARLLLSLSRAPEQHDARRFTQPAAHR